MGEWLGRRLEPGSNLCLVGELGSGKTTFIKGLAIGLGLKTKSQEVGSPTYILVREYPCRVPLCHVDLYRLDVLESADQELIMECFEKKGVTVVEWGEKAVDLFPRDYLRVELKHGGGDKRAITFHPEGEFQVKALKGK